jgi:hypothetical protein
MAGVKGKSGGARPGAGRKRGSINPNSPIRVLATQMTAMRTQLDAFAVQRRNEHESLPGVLRRLTEIERLLGMREKRIEANRHTRHRPLGVERQRAEEVFKSAP